MKRKKDLSSFGLAAYLHSGQRVKMK